MTDFVWTHLRLEVVANLIPHLLHMLALMPLCRRRWTFKWDFWVKDFPHSSHVCGLRPS